MNNDQNIRRSYYLRHSNEVILKKQKTMKERKKRLERKKKSKMINEQLNNINTKILEIESIIKSRKMWEEKQKIKNPKFITTEQFTLVDRITTKEQLNQNDCLIIGSLKFINQIIQTFEYDPLEVKEKIRTHTNTYALVIKNRKLMMIKNKIFSFDIETQKKLNKKHLNTLQLLVDKGSNVLINPIYIEIETIDNNEVILID